MRTITRSVLHPHSTCSSGASSYDRSVFGISQKKARDLIEALLLLGGYSRDRDSNRSISIDIVPVYKLKQPNVPANIPASKIVVS